MPSIDDFAELLGGSNRMTCRYRDEDQLIVSQMRDVGRRADWIGKRAIAPAPHEDLVAVPSRSPRNGLAESARADHSDSEAHR